MFNIFSCKDENIGRFSLKFTFKVYIKQLTIFAKKLHRLHFDVFIGDFEHIPYHFFNVSLANFKHILVCFEEFRFYYLLANFAMFPSCSFVGHLHPTR